MKNFVYALFCLAPIVSFAGCGGGEEAPPTTSPQMTADEKAHMESEVAKMKDMYSKNKGGKKK